MTIHSRAGSTLILLGVAWLAFVGCRTDKPAADAVEEQTPNHLAKVQALGLASFTEGSTVVYYSKDREARARAVMDWW